jgi:oxygen-independent coproporphyrinogen-3 oxidase
LVAALEQQIIPAMPTFRDQAMMRLHTYGCLVREGWQRRGTNTYIDPRRIEPEVVERIAGNECIGASHYGAFLLGAGPQAISSLPGARVENQVNIREWAAAIERGDDPYHLPKCSDVHQKDTALWVFPLRWEGLPQALLDRMLQCNALSAEQLSTLHDFEREGLVIRSDTGYALSILGEVFMGRLVRDLKGKAGQAAVDQYIEEGRSLGRAIATGAVPDLNDSNNRQLADLRIETQGLLNDR